MYFCYLCRQIMKFYLAILFLFTTCLVALPMNAVQACGNTTISKGQEISVSQAGEEHCAPADDGCVKTHPGQNCPPDTDGCGHCHCPGCGTTGATCAAHASFFKNDCIELSAPDWLYDRQAANFCYRAPCTSAHLAALFQPPRI